MLYARFMYPDSGFDCDVEYAREAGLRFGQKYEVDAILMGQSNTSVYLSGFDGSFNSVQFEFEDESGNIVDIYGSPKYNPYFYI